mgnify:CR=1 FL=1
MTNALSPSRPTASARAVAFRPIVILLTAFLVVSCAMEAVLVAQSASGLDIDTAIWIRCSLVLASSVTVLLFAIAFDVAVWFRDRWEGWPVEGFVIGGVLLLNAALGAFQEYRSDAAVSGMPLFTISFAAAWSIFARRL